MWVIGCPAFSKELDFLADVFCGDSTCYGGKRAKLQKFNCCPSENFITKRFHRLPYVGIEILGYIQIVI